MTVEFSVIKVSDNLDKVMGLLEQHYEELSVTKNFKLNPDYQIYLEAEKKGTCRAIACLNEGEIIGYIVYFIGINLHYKDCLLATEDIYYLKPEYRRGLTGLRMFKFAEDYLKTLGVNMVRYSTKTHMDNTRLFEFLGCSLIEKVFIKNL